MIKAAIKHVSDMVTKRATAGSPSSSDDEEDEIKDEIFDPVTPSKGFILQFRWFRWNCDQVSSQLHS
jgi:hypothetical protein